MTLLVIVVVSITCAALLGLQWTGSKAQTTVAAVRADAMATDSVLDSMIGEIRINPAYAPAPTGSLCTSTDPTSPNTIYQDATVKVLCTSQPGAAPNRRDFLLEAYTLGTPGQLLAQTSIDVADVDLTTGNPQTGSGVRVRSWVEEPSQ